MSPENRGPKSPPWTEAERLAALRDYGILDTAAEADFDDLVELASQICGTPISLISLVDESRQWFKARKGLDVTETSRAVSFCAHAIQSEGLFEVTDPVNDPRFSSNPLVTGDPNLRFYAGELLTTATGLPLGTLCVIDDQPHAPLSTKQQKALKTLARQVMAQLELRRAVYGHTMAGELLASENHFLQGKLIEQTGELRVNQAALRQSMKMEALGQLTGGIAHDFNNLLQGIVGSTTAARKLLTLGRVTEVDRFLGQVISAAHRAAGLTTRLLAFARNQPLEPVTVDVQKSLRSLNEVLRRVCGESIHVDLQEADALWSVRCDPNQLENAVLNLAINARDAMPDGGRLVVHFSNQHVAEIPLRYAGAVPGDFVCICVDDSGTGMSTEVLGKAFDAFFTTKPAGQGTGLGLSMVHSFVRQSGGFIEVESQPGRGTTIRLFLPRSDREAVSASASLPQPDATALFGKHVAIVEDDLVVADLMRSLLVDLGCQVFFAPDGAAGLRILESAERIDLLITDVGLPGLSGVRLADIARAARPHLQVLLITGYGQTQKTNSVPPESILAKPFSMEALVDRIRSLLEVPDPQR